VRWPLYGHSKYSTYSREKEMPMRDRPATKISRRLRERSALPDPKERRALRESAGLSANDLAVALGVTAPTVLRWELGDRTPRGGNLTNYLAVLEALRSETGSPAGGGR
jgi:DNA-binding transcriptional regulator YiaG